MCLAIPGKILKVEGQKITVEYPGQIRQALAGGESVKIGDWILVQMGVVIKILTPEEAKKFHPKVVKVNEKNRLR